MATKSRGAPYPLGTDANNTAADIDALAGWVNDRPGIAQVTTTQRNALAGVELWDGRVVANTTTDRLNRYDAGTATWIVIPDNGDIGALLATTGLPAALGTASRGVSTSAARADHVHPEPVFTSYTPTLTGFTVSSQEAYHCAIGKQVTVTWRAIIAGVTAPMYVALPFNAARLPASTLAAGVAFAGDISANVYAVGAAYFDSVSRIGFVSNGANATWTQVGNPFAWAAGDTISATITYERA
jgi:hypothetical protein